MRSPPRQSRSKPDPGRHASRRSAGGPWPSNLLKMAFGATVPPRRGGRKGRFSRGREPLDHHDRSIQAEKRLTARSTADEPHQNNADHGGRDPDDPKPAVRRLRDVGHGLLHRPRKGREQNPFKRENETDRDQKVRHPPSPPNLMLLLPRCGLFRVGLARSDLRTKRREAIH